MNNMLLLCMCTYNALTFTHFFLSDFYYFMIIVIISEHTWERKRDRRTRDDLKQKSQNIITFKQRNYVCAYNVRML